ncbi:unnamed protein product [Prunus brigantina]
MPWKYNFGSRSIVGLETGLLAQQGLTRCFARLCFTMSLGISFRMSFCGGKRSMRYNYNFIKPENTEDLRKATEPEAEIVHEPAVGENKTNAGETENEDITKIRKRKT